MHTKTMTVGRTLFYFSFWVFACALGLLFDPNIMLSLLGISTENSIIARIFGMVLLLFVLVDVAGALWTLSALKKEQ